MREARDLWSVFTGGLGAAISTMIRGRNSKGNTLDHPNRVHLFAGKFATEDAMFAYCFNPVSVNGPEQLNLDLTGVSVDTHRIEAAFGDQILPRLSEYFGRKERRRIIARLQPGECAILIPVTALPAGDYALNDTSHLRHIGHEDSLAMAAAMVAT